MKRIGRGQKAALLCGAAFVVVVPAAVPLWPEAVARYYEARLRKDRAFLLEALRAAEGSGPRLALERYVRTPEGRTALRDTFFELVLASVHSSRHDLRGSSRIELGVSAGSRDYNHWGPSGGEISSMQEVVYCGGYTPPPGEFEWCGSLLSHVERGKLHSAGLPGWVFDLGSDGGASFSLTGHREPVRSVPDLIADLSSGDSGARLEALLDLAALGPRAAEAVPQLVRALRDDSEEMRAAAQTALGEVGPPAVQAILDLLRTERREPVRSAAVVALSWKEEIRAATEHRLDELSASSDTAERELALQVLKDFHGGQEPVRASPPPGDPADY